MVGVIVLDANAVIALAEPTDPHHHWITTLLLEHPEASLSISALTLAECLVHPARTEQTARALTALAPLQLDVEELTELSAVRLASVRAMSRLKMPDAVVLHTAIERAGSIATADAEIARAAHAAGIATLTP